MILTIPYETPSKKNSRIVSRKTGRSFPSKAYGQWHIKAALWLRTHYTLSPLGEGPFMVQMEFRHGTLQRSDADNKTSSILDLLVDMKILPDDSWKVVRSIYVTNSYDKGNPSVTVKIFPYIEDNVNP